MVGLSPPPSRTGPRLVRVRADELAPEGPGVVDAGRIAMAARPGIAIGDRLEVEVSFGPLTDEVVFPGEVVAAAAVDGQPPRLVVEIPHSERHRISYVRQVLAGEREPVARSQRRVPTDREIGWFRRTGRFEGRLRDVSGRGAFVAARLLPTIGETVVLHLEDPGRPRERLVVECEVTWVREEALQSGFGVRFRIRDRDEAAQIGRFVRACAGDEGPSRHLT